MLRRDEFTKIIEYLIAVYPEMEKAFNLQTTQAVWYDLLKDIDFNDLTLACKVYCATGRFAPKPADIRALVAEATTDYRDWSSGWSLVLRSIQRFGMYQEAEALEWIGEQDKTASESIRRLGYKNLCMADDEIAFRANFRKVYESENDRQKFYSKLPPESKKKMLENKEKARNKLIQLNPGLKGIADDYLDAIGGES